jgi:tetratricopeptide (TPR) repeat protein
MLRERHTKITVVLTLVLILAGLGLTQSFVNLHRQTELGLAHRWFARGEQAMQADLPEGAAEAYRTALNYDRENKYYRLRLAQALMGAATRLSRPERARAAEAEARAHLLSLWEEEPANGEVNLTLARLEARRGRFANAVRYYNDAINGVWQNDPRKQRNEARLELAQFLLQQHNPARAQAELLALLADAPRYPADQLRLGQMLLQVNDPSHALQAFDLLLTKDPDNAQALLGRGQAYLMLGNYTEAERASARALQHDPNLQGARQQLDLARELTRIDPLQRGLPLAERAERVARDFDAAFTALATCAAEKKLDLTPPATVAPGPAPGAANGETPPNAAPGAAISVPAPNSLQLLYSSGLQRQANVTPQALRKNPDALEPTMQYVFEVERALAPICPDLSLTDHALLVLAGHEREASQ